MRWIIFTFLLALFVAIASLIDLVVYHNQVSEVPLFISLIVLLITGIIIKEK